VRETRIRRVSRVVTLDPTSRVLLFDTHLAYTHVWMTPGGALKEGERYADAAVRELWEEAGISTASLSGCVWTVRFKFPYRGIIYDQRERYFVARVESSTVTGDFREVSERSEIRACRWWSLREIAESSAAFRPDSLVDLLPAVLAGEHPKNPIVATVESCARVL
jgi:8-oxo-dGTP pyrophosphatase MutT (NUDIX family)